MEVLTATEEELEVAAMARQVPSWFNAPAALLNAATLAFTDVYEAEAVCAVVTLAFRRFCGACSTCMSWAITVDVLMPLTSPSTELDDTVACLSVRKRSGGNRRGSAGYPHLFGRERCVFSSKR
ncbi:hypothetical protein Ato02nite_041310 [Paractinoplanes toevensis]|uniref:Uncharacterized protein n=1 Tax=Paractinoplanes toevensis TaxID=571911 RepID=A0A919TBG1_9ACTN|nr:hypothetical protein Ato02nite_041310 [Actinoplanes toevensis]